MTAKQRKLPLLLGVALMAIGAGGCASQTPSASPTVSPPPLSFETGAYVDYAERMVPCLQNAGWPASIAPGNGVQMDGVSVDQREDYEAALRDCRDEFDFDTSARQLSESQVSEAYPHYLWTVRCLEEAGYELTTPPSEDEFAEAYVELDGLLSPYSLIQNLKAEELPAAWDRCVNPYAT